MNDIDLEEEFSKLESGMIRVRKRRKKNHSTFSSKPVQVLIKSVPDEYANQQIDAALLEREYET